MVNRIPMDLLVLGEGTAYLKEFMPLLKDPF